MDKIQIQAYHNSNAKLADKAYNYPTQRVREARDWMLVGFDPSQIQDLEGARQAIVMLLNLVEDLKSENDALREEGQKLRDEINRLKGEQGKPDIKPGKKPPHGDHSSEKERRRPRI
ncbi:MAG: hypothetical protein ACE5H9_17800 [Anaerolineae bacterium]